MMMQETTMSEIPKINLKNWDLESKGRRHNTLHDKFHTKNENSIVRVYIDAYLTC